MSSVCVHVMGPLVTMSQDDGLGALLLLGQLGLDLLGELVQVLVHAPHAEPLGVEKAAVRSNTDACVAKAAGRAQNQKLLLVRTEGVLGYKTLL